MRREDWVTQFLFSMVAAHVVSSSHDSTVSSTQSLPVTPTAAIGAATAPTAESESESVSSAAAAAAGGEDALTVTCSSTVCTALRGLRPTTKPWPQVGSGPSACHAGRMSEGVPKEGNTTDGATHQAARRRCWLALCLCFRPCLCLRLHRRSTTFHHFMTDDIFCIIAPSRASVDRRKQIVPVGALAAAAYRQPPAAP